VILIVFGCMGPLTLGARACLYRLSVAPVNACMGTKLVLSQAYMVVTKAMITAVLAAKVLGW
jgi:hypothetical protein